MLVFVAVLLAFLGQSEALFFPKSQGCKNRRFELMYEWKTVEYDTPPGYRPDPAYQRNASYISGIAAGLGNTLYVSTPRTLSNLPATVATMPKENAGTRSPILKPFPDITWNTVNVNNTDCEHTFISVEKMETDHCNRLWILDTGVLLNLAKYQRICPPKIHIFDMNTSQQIRTITVPMDVLTPISDLFNIVLDYEFVLTNRRSNSCDDVFVYMSDLNSPSIIVHKSPENMTYKISHPYMYPDPYSYLVEAEGELFSYFGGIIGMAPLGSGLNRNVYFNPVTSKQIFYIPASVLQAGPFNGDPSQLPVYVALNKSSPGPALNADEIDKCLMFNPISAGAVVGWSPISKQQKILAYNPRIIVEVEDMKPDNVYRNTTYLTMPRVQKYIKGEVNENEINLRFGKLIITEVPQFG